MNFTLSPQIKIVALAGLLGALGLGVGSMLLAQSQKFSASPVTTVPLRHAHLAPRPALHVGHAPAPAKAHVAAHAPAKTHTRPQTTHRAASPAQPRTHAPVRTHVPAPTRHVAQPVHEKRVSPAPAVAANGLPTALDRLLREHQVVVVSLYDPEVAADAISLAEARAGASDAHAGFLAVDVLDGRVAGPLTAVAGQGTVLPDPGILIYRQPGTLMNRIEGFSDRAAVAQAVASALVADAPAGS